MYQMGGGPGHSPPSQRQWDPNAQHQQPPPPQHPQHQQGPPPGYRQDQQPLAPVNGAYPPRPDQHMQNGQGHQIRPDRPEMAAVHPSYYQQPGPYLPAPSQMYPPPPPDQYRPPPPPGQANAGQSAPRQRTAIACKYCRRRKIRCSGFENSEDGRCSNCIRFSQECVFTPVSAQTQAFVPAQALYGRGGRTGAPPQPPRQLYGPYGNPLPPHHEQYAPHPQHGYPMPSPGAYPYPPGQPPYGYPQPPPPPPQGYDISPNNRRRPRDESHTPTLPPPNPGPGAHLAGPRPEHDGGPPAGYTYPDPSGYALNPASGSPNAPNPNYGNHPQPYYAQPPPPHLQQPGGRRNSPGATSAYSYDPSRDSNSPHSAAGFPAYPGQQPLQPHQQISGQGARTPPPTSGDRGRNGMSIHDMMSEGGNRDGNRDGNGERTAADSHMVSALNRPPARR